MSDANIQMHKLDAGIRYHWDIRIQCRYESIQMVIQQIESYSAHSMRQSHFAFNRLKSRKSIFLYIPPLDVSAVPVLLRQSLSGCGWMMCLAETTQFAQR